MEIEMKELYFTTELQAVFRHDAHYGLHKNAEAALRKLGLTAFEKSSNIDQIYYAMAVHLMDRYGESEAFLSETFIYPEAIVQSLKDHGLPVPAALQPENTTKSAPGGHLDPAVFEQYFDKVCRNCGTVTDPLASSYRTPIGRLILRTFLETRLASGINTTGKYVMEKLKDFDSDEVVTSIEEDYVTWRCEEDKEKLTSLHTIEKYVLNFNRELETLL